MKLELSHDRTIPTSYPKTFYRVEYARTGRVVADFDTETEAHKKADKLNAGGWDEYKVSKMRLAGA